MKYLIRYQLFEAEVNRNGDISGIQDDVFDEFPEDVLKTLEDNYGTRYSMNFDWNAKTREFGYDDVGNQNFHKWWEARKQTEFIKQLDSLIHLIREDLLTMRRKDMAKRKLEAFEELIIPVLGNNIMMDALTKFEAEVLMNPHATIEDIERGFQEAKNIIDENGNVDYSKIEKSTIFPDGQINIPKFEEFVKKNPEYQKTYDIWKKLFDEEMELMLKDTNSYHIVSYKELRKLYDFLIEYRNKRKK